MNSEKYLPLGPHGWRRIPGMPNPFSNSSTNSLGIFIHF